MIFSVPTPRRPGTLPAILSRAEVQRPIAQAPNPKHHAMLLTMYASGSTA